MKSTGSFKRILAVLCTAALLTCSVSALAVSPADVSASASLSAVNSVSEAQLRSALSKLTVTYDSEAEGWQIDSPYEEASMEKASCGLYPYLFVTNDDPTVYLSLGMTYFGNKKLDMKSVRVETVCWDALWRSLVRFRTQTSVFSTQYLDFLQQCMARLQADSLVSSDIH